MLRVGVIDYGAGNLASVCSAFKFVGAEPLVVDKPSRLAEFSAVVLPGVGSFKSAMSSLKNSGFDQALCDVYHQGKSKMLGICLGMQLFAEKSSEDGETSGLGFIPGNVERFDNRKFPELKIPHVGFSPVEPIGESRMLVGLGESPDFYFVHSYKLTIPKNKFSGGISEYSEKFLSTYEDNLLFATQFHPEKSQTNGLKLLKNFIEA